MTKSWELRHFPRTLFRIANDVTYNDSTHAPNSHVHSHIAQLLCAMLLLDGLQASLRH